MSTAGKILQHIVSLGASIIFTTREMLHHGSRSSVDSTLSRLVGKGVIRRLAAGVFVAAKDLLQLPSAFEIAAARAQAFCKRLVKPVMASQLSEDSTTFLTDGCRSSIATVHGRLHFKPVSMRKLKALERQQNRGNHLDAKLLRPETIVPAAMSINPALALLQIFTLLNHILLESAICSAKYNSSTVLDQR